MIKNFLLVVITCFFNFNAVPVNTGKQLASIPTTQDSLPPLHTIPGKDISSIQSSFEHGTLVVTLTNGTIYTYQRADWDYEDSYPGTDKKITDAMNSIKRTYTKAQHMPEFPGGTEAWEKYVKEFCHQHYGKINENGPETFTMSFIVHTHGQVSDISILLGNLNSDLAELAIKCIQSGPAWQPATMNGDPVPCYQRQVVKLTVQ